MDARSDFAYLCFQFHAEVVQKIREVSKETGRVCGILADLKGPEIRTGGFKEGVKSVRLNAGQRFTFYVNFIRGDETKVSIKYWNLPKLVKVSKNKNKNKFFNLGILFFKQLLPVTYFNLF